MSNLNKAQIIGHLGQDPDTRYMPSGGAVTNLRVATTDKWKDRDSGEKRERTEWHSVTMFGKLGEIAAEYLRKGSLVYIEGRIQTDKWQDKGGNDRYTTKIIAKEMKMLGGKTGSQRSAEAPQTPAPAAQPGPDDFDDDIPF